MSVLYIAVPVALLISLVAVIAFAKQMKSGQLDDLETPAMRMLFDDVETFPERESNKRGHDV